MNQTSHEDLEDVKQRVRQHLMIAGGLVVGTLLTLWTSQTNFGNHALNMGMTYGVAVVQGFFVVAFFMHLLSERKVIYSFLVFTALFFIVMMAVTFWAHLPGNVVHYTTR